jgi:hypothetical protein
MNMFLFALTCASWVIAGFAMFLAWRTLSAARRESDLRVAALSADLHEREDLGDVLLSAPLFQAETSETADGRGRVALVAGALVIGTVLSLVVGLSALGGTADGTKTVNRAPTAPPPLELVALTHDRSANQLTVRGAIRNPAAGHEIDGLTAVVLLYNTDGSYVATGRAPVAQPALLPGAESTFSITLPDQAALGRYRVSFRTGDQVIAHVDERAPRQDR